FGESRYNPMLPRVVSDLKAAGIAIESQGATVVTFSAAKMPPLLIQKAGGEGYLYGTTDLAAVWYRTLGIGATRLVYLVDSRQSLHFDQVFEAARLVGWAAPATSLEHAPFGTMLGEDGKPFKSRSGELVKLKELLDEAEERALKVVTEKNPELPEAQRKQVAH